MTDTNDLLRRARRAQREAEREMETPPSKDEAGERSDTPAVPRRQRLELKNDPGQEDADDALVSAGTFQLLENLVNLAKDGIAWTWDKSRRTSEFLAAKVAHWRARREQHLAERKAEQQRIEATQRKALEALAAQRPAEAANPVAEAVAAEPVVFVAPPAPLPTPAPMEAPTPAAVVPAPVEIVPAPQPVVLQEGTDTAPQDEPLRVHAQRRIRAAFVVACLLTLVMGGAWWWKHGAPASEMDAPAVAAPVPTAEVAPVEPEAPETEAQVAPPAPPAPVVAAPPVETVAAPAPRVEVIETRPAAAAPRAAKPRPVPTPAPAPKDAWQDEAQDEMDAWAEQMGIEER